MKGSSGLVAFLAGLAVGWSAATLYRSPAPAVVDPTLRDSLTAATARADSLEAASGRALTRARVDSIALAQLQSRVRVRPRPAPVNPTPSDTATVPDTVTVYEVPAPVAALVVRLERRVGSLEVALDTTALALIAERNARKIAETIARQAEGALEAERKRRWRYRLEGAGIGGIFVAIAAIVLSL